MLQRRITGNRVGMHLVRGARLDHEAREGAELLRDEVLVHGADGQQGVDGHARLRDVAV